MASAVVHRATSVAATLLGSPRAAVVRPLFLSCARNVSWAAFGGAQRSPLSGTVARRGATKTNPGQKARGRKPEYKIPAWSAPPKRILAAVVVERLPVVTPDPEPWETAMWELQERKAMALAKPLPDDWFRDDSGGLRKAEEEEGVEEQDPVAGFAPRKTPADDANDTKSLDRKLANRLFLVVKSKDGKLAGEGDWSFPQAERKDGESMRDVAMRSVAALSAESAQLYFVGYSPMSTGWGRNEGAICIAEFSVVGRLCAVGPPSSKLLDISKENLLNGSGYIDRGEGDARARVFYYKCQYISGQWDYKAVDDYMWLGNEELLSHLDASLADLTRNICDA